MSRYGYDYSFTSARPTGWRATVTSIMVVGTVMAVSAVSGVIVTLQLFGSPGQNAAVPRAVPAASVASAPAPVASHMVAFAARYDSAATTASRAAAPPATVAAAPVAQVPRPVAPPPQPAPVATVAQPAPTAAPTIADSDLTFAKGYAQRRAVATGAISRQGKLLVAEQTQLGRAAFKPKPRVYARVNPNSTAQNRRGDAFGMFQRFDRPDQFDVNRHQALAFGEQRTQRRRNDAPPQRSNGFFGGMF